MGAVFHEPKGRPPLRPCPDDFDVIFVEKGRDGCESWYRARKTTVTRWLIERGKERLIQRRAAYVKTLRQQGKWLTRSSRMVETHQPKAAVGRTAVKDKRKVCFALARHAAQYLRVSRNGGFIVSPTAEGDWWIGYRICSAAQLIDLAVSRGFDAKAAALQVAMAEAVDS